MRSMARLCAVALVLAACTSARAVPVAGSELGVNLGWIGTTWDSTQVYGDLLKSARAFGGTGCVLNADGWPDSDCTAQVIEGGTSPAGNGYTLTWTGTGTATMSGATVVSTTYDAGSNTTTVVLNVTSASNNTITWQNTHRTNGGAAGFTDAHLMRPGHVWPTDYWNKAFGAALAPFTLVRCMNCVGRSSQDAPMHATDTAWSSRVPADSHNLSTAGRGVPWEDIVKMGNDLNRSLYLTIPYLADDDYLLQLARLLRYGSDASGTPYTTTQESPVHPPLKAGLHVYIEWGNEIWNNVSQAVALSDASVAAGDPEHLNYDSSGNRYVEMYRYVGYKTVKTSETFRSVFGDAAMGTVVRIVLAGQQANYAVLDGEVSYVQNVWGPGSSFSTIDGAPNPKRSFKDYVYAVSYAPYLRYGTATPTDNETAFQALSNYYSVATGGSAPTISASIDHYESIAAGLGCKTITYEGGLEIWTSNAWDTYVTRTETRMRDLYNTFMGQYLAAPSSAGFIHLGFVSTGVFGLSDSLAGYGSTPRWLAIQDQAAAIAAVNSQPTKTPTPAILGTSPASGTPVPSNAPIDIQWR